MEMKTVPSGVLHRGVDLDRISKDMTLDPHWQVNQVVSKVRTYKLVGSLVGLMGSIGLSAVLVLGAMMTGVSPEQTDAILGFGFIAATPVAMPMGFALFRHTGRRDHYLLTMNQMGIFNKPDRERFLKTMKALKPDQALFVQTPPSIRQGDIGIWKVTSKSLTFYGVKPGDGGWEDALEQVISYYDLTTREPFVWDNTLDDDELEYEDEYGLYLERKIQDYTKYEQYVLKKHYMIY